MKSRCLVLLLLRRVGMDHVGHGLLAQILASWYAILQSRHWSIVLVLGSTTVFKILFKLWIWCTIAIIVVRICNYCINSHWKIFQARASIQWTIWTVVGGELLLHDLINHSYLLEALRITTLPTRRTQSMSYGLQSRDWVHCHHKMLLAAAVVIFLCHLQHLSRGEHDLGLLNWGRLVQRDVICDRLTGCIGLRCSVRCMHHLANDGRNLQLLFRRLLLDSFIMLVISCRNWRECMDKVSAEGRSTDLGSDRSRWCTWPCHQLLYLLICVNIDVTSVFLTVGFFLTTKRDSRRSSTGRRSAERRSARRLFCQHLLLLHLIWVESVCYYFFFHWIRVRNWCTLYFYGLHYNIRFPGLSGKCFLDLLHLVECLNRLVLRLFDWWSSFLLFRRNSLFFKHFSRLMIWNKDWLFCSFYWWMLIRHHFSKGVVLRVVLLAEDIWCWWALVSCIATPVIHVELELLDQIFIRHIWKNSPTDVAVLRVNNRHLRNHLAIASVFLEDWQRRLV